MIERRAWVFGLALIVLAVIFAGELHITRADDPPFWVFSATMDGTADGEPLFTAPDAASESQIYWTVAGGTIEQWNEYPGILSSSPKKPPICTCPVEHGATCRCKWVKPVEPGIP
ncbi:MAG: hypothetical protein Q9Q13_12885 [Acidobacteriota bacterium]|nr:hypothetical protein [Acidobacteriota bacterium]